MQVRCVLVAVGSSDQNRSDGDADPNRVEIRILMHDLTDGPTKSGAERPALQDPPDRIAGRIVEILGDAKAQMELVEQDVVAPGSSWLRPHRDDGNKKLKSLRRRSIANPGRILFVSGRCERG